MRIAQVCLNRNAAPARSGYVGTVLVSETIICVECQGTCHLLSHRPDDDPFVPGDIVAYRCPDCLERFDLVLEDDDDEHEPQF